MIPNEKIIITLKSVRKNDHYIVLIEHENERLVYDPTTNPEKFYSADYYYKVIASALPRVENGTSFSMEVTLAACYGYTAFAELFDKIMYDLFKDQIKKPTIWDDYCRFMLLYFPNRGVLVRDDAVAMMTKLIDTIQKTNQIVKMKEPLKKPSISSSDNSRFMPLPVAKRDLLVRDEAVDVVNKLMNTMQPVNQDTRIKMK